jgi:hypothetical protein
MWHGRSILIVVGTRGEVQQWRPGSSGIYDAIVDVSGDHGIFTRLPFQDRKIWTMDGMK